MDKGLQLYEEAIAAMKRAAEHIKECPLCCEVFIAAIKDEKSSAKMCEEGSELNRASREAIDKWTQFTEKLSIN